MSWHNIADVLGAVSFIWLVVERVGRAFFTGGGGHRNGGWR